LLVARQAMDSRRTAERNALTALLRSFDLGMDARKPITDTQVREVAGWRQRSADDAAMTTIRQEARRLAVSVQSLTLQLAENQAALAGHVQELAPGLQQLLGVGAVTGAILVTAYSHQGRVRSEAAFAALAGASPLAASSGNTTRHRLNRHGDRQLNRALDVIARVRLSCEPPTRDYLARRLAEGKSKREIRRSLKRYIAWQLFRQLSAVMPDPVGQPGRRPRERGRTEAAQSLSNGTPSACCSLGFLSDPAADHSELRQLRSLHALFADSTRCAPCA
jgi:transposase